MSPPVSVVDLHKTFQDESRGEVRAVDGVAFEARPGEVFGLLGANGAGKTTTLRMLSTIILPTSGTARIMGYDVVDEAPDVRRSLGFYSATTAQVTVGALVVHAVETQERHDAQAVASPFALVLRREGNRELRAILTLEARLGEMTNLGGELEIERGSCIFRGCSPTVFGGHEPTRERNREQGNPPLDQRTLRRLLVLKSRFSSSPESNR